MYQISFEVRDSELDTQGIVNNANYFVYFEHARHQFLKQKLAIDFAAWAARGQYLVLLKTETAFKHALQANDSFYVTVDMIPAGRIRVVFMQTIYHSHDDRLVATSKNIGTCLDSLRGNKPYLPDAIKHYLQRQEKS